MENYEEQIDKMRLPQHVAIIMDGNGRWAKQKGEKRTFGHEHGVDAVRAAVEVAGKLGIQCLTLYAFSTENWNRPQEEVDTLMSLFVQAIHAELDNLKKHNVRLRVIGDVNRLQAKTQDEVNRAIQELQQNTGLTLALAISYSSQWEIVEAVKHIATQVQQGKLLSEQITTQTIDENLTTVGLPKLDLLIRTGGEYRISNFLLWQAAYAELYFTPTLWPDFRHQDFYKAIVDFQHRERRYGKTGEQVQGK